MPPPTEALGYADMPSIIAARYCAEWRMGSYSFQQSRCHVSLIVLLPDLWHDATVKAVRGSFA